MRKDLTKQVFSVLAGFVFIWITQSAQAQQQLLKAGDQCPGSVLNDIKRIVKNSHYAENLGQPVLIDFWATWCSPCLRALPGIDSLQRVHQHQLTVLSVLEDNDTKVPEVLSRIFNKKTSILTYVDHDSVLHAAFPHSTIPHFVWIDKNGFIKVITSDEKAILLNLEQLLKDAPTSDMQQKVPALPYDGIRPLYASKQANLQDELAYHSVITHWRPDISSESARGDNFINCLNTSTLWLYQIAFGKFNLQFLDLNRVILEGFHTKADTVAVGYFYTDSLKKLWRQSKRQHLYSYELVVPDSTYTFDERFEIMQQDLNRFFKSQRIHGSLEKRMKIVYELKYVDHSNHSLAFVKTAEEPAYYSTPAFIKMTNQPVSFFLTKLAENLKDKSKPLLNGTTYNDIVNIELNDTSSLGAINSGLAKYGLILQENQVLLDILVLKKASP